MNVCNLPNNYVETQNFASSQTNVNRLYVGGKAGAATCKGAKF